MKFKSACGPFSASPLRVSSGRVAGAAVRYPHEKPSLEPLQPIWEAEEILTILTARFLGQQLSIGVLLYWK